MLRSFNTADLSIIDLDLKSSGWVWAYFTIMSLMTSQIWKSPSSNFLKHELAFAVLKSKCSFSFIVHEAFICKYQWEKKLNFQCKEGRWNFNLLMSLFWYLCYINPHALAISPVNTPLKLQKTTELRENSNWKICGFKLEVLSEDIKYTM